MKKLLVVLSLAMVMMCFTAFNAAAIPFTGAISFSGTDAVDNQNLTLATKFLTFDNVVVSATGGAGAYAPAVAGTPVTFTPFTFSPTSTVTPLWSFVIGTTTYSFDVTTMSIVYRDSQNMTVLGSGIGHITGLTDTPGTWSVTANTNGSTASFSGGSSTVPEPATLLLLGLGLVGLGLARGKHKKV